MIKPILTATVTLMTVMFANAAQPNIVYILADDMGPGDVMAYNKDCKFPTPHLDRMAAEGMKFMDAHTSSSVCTPTWITKPGWELYDLLEDPQELNNVYNEPRYAAIVTQLKRDLLKLKKDLDDQDEAYPELMAVRKKHW
jgi:hypothetical protein